MNQILQDWKKRNEAFLAKAILADDKEDIALIENIQKIPDVILLNLIHKGYNAGLKEVKRISMA